MSNSTDNHVNPPSSEDAPSDRVYDADAKVVVLSADRIGGLVAPGVLVNHVTETKIYGDGKVVFINPAVGSGEIHEGRVEPGKIAQLFTLLKAKGFWTFNETYTIAGPADMASSVITARLHGQPEKRVSCYGGALSAPPGFMDCFEQLTYPQLVPKDIQTYVRVPITQAELDAGWYFGFEYQKKLNTPRDWVWVEAGRSSKWQRPAPVAAAVTLDSSYMIPTVHGCHHIRIGYSGSPAAGGTIQFDRNGMSPDPYGDIGITTLIYFTPQAATFTLVQEEAKKHLFAISVPGYVGPKLRLVVFGDLGNPDGGRLLVLDDHDVIQNIFCLQRL